MVKKYNYINVLEHKVDLLNHKIIIYGLSKSALDLYIK